jgi:hypothetical protein
MKHILLLLTALALLLGGVGQSRADMITQNFTITIGPPAVTLVPDADDNSFVSVSRFNPAKGTLTSVSLSLTRSGLSLTRSRVALADGDLNDSSFLAA